KLPAKGIIQMLFARRLTVAATAGSLIAGGFFVSLLSNGEAQAQTAAGSHQAQAAGSACQDALELTVMPSPNAPWKGAPLRVMAVTENPVAGTFSLIAPDGSVAVKSAERHGGAPYSWFAEVAAPAAGTWRATLVLDQGPADCRTITNEITVAAKKPAPI